MFKKKIVISEVEFTKVGECEVLDCVNPDDTNRKRIKFNLKCVCGDIRQVSMYHIGRCEKIHCKKCGFKKLALSKKKTDAGLNNLVLHYKKGAERRKIPFQLSKEEIREVTSKNCTYCNKKPSMLSYSNKTWENRSQYVYNGIDRINSSIGYVKNNVTTCCKECNIAKASMTVEEFKDFIKRIYEFFINKDV